MNPKVFPPYAKYIYVYVSIYLHYQPPMLNIFMYVSIYLHYQP